MEHVHAQPESATCAKRNARAIRASNVIIDLINVATSHTHGAHRSHEDDSRLPFSCGSTIFIPPRHCPAVVHSTFSLSPLRRACLCSRQSRICIFWGAQSGRIERGSVSRSVAQNVARERDDSLQILPLRTRMYVRVCKAHDYLIVNFSRHYAFHAECNLRRGRQPLYR